MSLFRTIVWCGTICGGALGVSAADPVTWLPAEVNAVARINVTDLYNSPLAKKEGWRKQATESFVQQDSLIPPGTQQMFLAANLDLSENLVSHRKYAVLVPEGNLTLNKLSDWLPNGVESISGKPGAQFGEDGFVVDAGDGCWLATTQTSRQSMARWLKTGPTTGGRQLSDYLQSALNSKSNTAQAVLAIDLADNFSPSRIADELKATDWFPSPSTAESVAEVLASVEGITISIRVDQDRTGQVTLDFGKDAGVLKPVLKKLVESVLQRVGAASEEFTEWKWSVEANRILGTGPVSPGGGRQLLSILDPPSITHALSQSTEEQAKDKMAKTSQKYCKSVRVLLDDLQKTLKKTKDNHALWFERYGRKIDDLPKLNVDPELLDFSARVSSSLRYQGQYQRMSNIRAGTRIEQSGVNYNNGYGYVGPYGEYNWGSADGGAQTTNTIRAEQNEAAKGVRFSEWKQIEDGLAVLRRKMTEKYQLEF